MKKENDEVCEHSYNGRHSWVFRNPQNSEEGPAGTRTRDARPGPGAPSLPG